MATVESSAAEGQRVVREDRDYVIHSWSVQSAIQPLPVAGAEGRYFWDYDGNRYLDFASQLVNVSIGHQHPKLVAAIKEQADRLCTIGPPMANDKRSELARLLSEVTPGDLRYHVLHERRRRGQRERDQAGALGHRPPQGDRALPLLPRRHRRGDHAHGRPAPLGRRAGHPRCRAHARPVHLPLPGRPPRPVPGLHGRAAPRGAPPVRERGHGRGRDPRDGDRHERPDSPAARLPAVDPRGLRPARHRADPGRGDGRLRPHRPLVRLRALGRRAGHHHDGEGHQLGLRAARRDDRAAVALRARSRTACSPAG